MRMIPPPEYSADRDVSNVFEPVQRHIPSGFDGVEYAAVPGQIDAVGESLYGGDSAADIKSGVAVFETGGLHGAGQHNGFIFNNR